MGIERERDLQRTAQRGNEDQGMRDDEIQAEQNEGTRKHLGRSAPERRAAENPKGGGESPTTVHGREHGHRADERNPGSDRRGS